MISLITLSQPDIKIAINKNEVTMQTVTLEPLVEGVKPGNTPVLLEVDATVYVNVTAEMY